MKVGMFIGKVKKFGISWCIPHRMAADNAKGGSGPPAPYRVKSHMASYNSMPLIG